MEDKKHQNAKKANLLDHHSIKQILDESVIETVKNRGFNEDVKMSNIRLFLGMIIIAIALFATFYNNNYPENRSFLTGCVILSIICNVLLQMTYTKKNAILVTYPPEGSLSSRGLVVSSKFLGHSYMFTLAIASTDSKSMATKHSAKFTKSVTRWFTTDGVFVEELFSKEVEKLLNECAKETKKSK